MRTAGLVVPASALGSVPISLGFWKAPSTVSAGPSDQPSNYSSMSMWYRSMDLSLNDNDPVSTWTDRSSNANNATNSGSARPTFKTNIVGTQPVLRFDGSTSLLNFTVVTYAINPHFTIMALLKNVSGSSTYVGSTTGHRLRLKTSTVDFNDTVVGDESSTFGGAEADLKLVTVRRDTDQTVIYRENKTARGVNGVGTQGFLIDTLGGCSFCGGAAKLNGDYIEFVAWNQVLSNAQCDSLYDNYFKFYYPTLP